MVPEKHAFMQKLLEDAWVHVHLDPRHPEVQLPDYLRSQAHVILQYGYNMPVPITDLRIDERGIGATLSFQRVAHATFVPWEAVFAIADGDQRGYVWERDVPAELRTVPVAEGVPSGQGPGVQSEEAATPPPTHKPGKRPRPSYLKLVD